ncbi:MAG: ethanolamine ammonia-lyase subunit EutB, partial [Planctomycetaceae bacterium]
MHGLPRRTFLAGIAAAIAVGSRAATPEAADLISHVARAAGGWDQRLYTRLLGNANAFKEGDELIGVAAPDEAARRSARLLLGRTTLAGIDAHPPFSDRLSAALADDLDAAARERTAVWTLDALARFLLTRPEPEIRAIMPGLSSDVIACVVRLMSDDELVQLGDTICNPLPGSRIGGRGCLAARLQPNSPTDDPDDIRWQVFDGWSYGVGDVVLGTNPVSSEAASVKAVSDTLRGLLEAFGLQDTMPHCVLAHIDVQAEVDATAAGSTGIWFQSIAGSDAANATFDVTLEKMLRHAAARRGPWGLYFETGQGADFTNGHAQGTDMVVHESRKYGFARLLAHAVARARGAPAWVHVNDVAGFIGPEVFRTREQLVRCCLEDLAMGKLHGLCIGLDVCATRHMDVSLDDLDWCLERVLPARPAYLMTLPTKVDPMLVYLTTGFQDHVRLRRRFGCRGEERMERFFQRVGVLDADGGPGPHFGDPGWVHVQYRRALGDTRPDDDIRVEGRREMAAVRRRGVFLAEGHGRRPEDLEPELDAEIRRIDADARQSIWAEFDNGFRRSQAGSLMLVTESADRRDYILHPATGERLAAASLAAVGAQRKVHADAHDVQVVVSDGLNPLAIMDLAQLDPFLAAVQDGLTAAGRRPAPRRMLVTSGRVRAGYRIGEQLFGGPTGPRAVLHVVGERPGTGHRTFSVYVNCRRGDEWAVAGGTDHQHTRVVASIAPTALDPRI